MDQLRNRDLTVLFNGIEDFSAPLFGEQARMRVRGHLWIQTVRFFLLS